MWAFPNSQSIRDLDDASALAQAIVDTIRDPLLVLDHNLRVVTANRAFYQTFRMSRQDIHGRPIASRADFEAYRKANLPTAADRDMRIEVNERTLADECVPIGDALNPSVAGVTPFMCHRDESEARILQQHANGVTQVLQKGSHAIPPHRYKRGKDPICSTHPTVCGLTYPTRAVAFSSLTTQPSLSWIMRLPKVALRSEWVT